LSGVENLRAPCVVVSNHSAWWDPLIAIWLTNRVTHVESYALMNAANLARLPFFGKVGAIGVDLADPRDGARVVRVTGRLLQGSQRVLWVFPQGEERPLYERPLKFRGGAEAIARIAKVPIVPVAIHYAFADREKPDLDVIIGTPGEDVETLLGRVPAQSIWYEAPTSNAAARLLAWLTQPSTK
jgi:1-acyl-sn-glycerol-3-phosphate acyltransferase